MTNLARALKTAALTQQLGLDAADEWWETFAAGVRAGYREQYGAVWQYLELWERDRILDREAKS